jgi:hypothetical protein
VNFTSLEGASRVFGPKRGRSRRRVERIAYEELRNFLSSRNITTKVKLRWMGWSVSVAHLRDDKCF